MARMLPDQPDTDIENHGERLVYSALREQLPDDWTVRHHYPACWKDGGYLRDFEADFIVIAPRLGLMFIEVKASNGFECTAAAWYRVNSNGTKVATRSPIDQVIGVKHRVVERLSEKVFNCKKHDFPGIFGHLVIYPKGELRGSLPTSIDSNQLVTRSSMSRLGSIIQERFLLWGDKSTGENFTQIKFKMAEDFFEENCRFVQVYAADVDADEEVIEELTKSQFEAFRHLLKLPRVIVSGPAGSGKTMIARWIAATYAKQGKKVLLLCYNTVLESWLKNNSEDIGYEVRSFFSFCRERILAARKPFTVPSDPQQKNNFWEEDAPNALFETLQDTPDEDKYDVILVDEAQDFYIDWWMSVQLLLKDPDQGGLYMFKDSNQSGVYGHGDDYPSSGVYPVELVENCRNTRSINQYCGSVIHSEIASPVNSPQGVPPEINQATPTVSHRAKAVQSAVNKLLVDGFRPSQIAILSPFGQKHDSSSVRHIESINGHPLAGDQASLQLWAKDEVIWASTIKSFKGLEADCVIITDLYPVGGNFTESDLYVACSRAKHKLLLFPINPDGADFLREHLNPAASDRGSVSHQS